MTTMKINIRKARERFSEIVNAVAIKGERVILLSKNKPKAAIVSLKDLQVLEDRSITKAKRLAQIERIKKVRERLAKKGVISDSLLTLKKMRKERIDQLTSSN
jgi:prevent-host-death family protein